MRSHRKSSIVDNGSSDGTAASFPQAILEVSAEPLSFARAVNRGIRRARYSHICLLNNDMIVEPGFFGHCAKLSSVSPICFALLPISSSRPESGAKRQARR